MKQCIKLSDEQHKKFSNKTYKLNHDEVKLIIEEYFACRKKRYNNKYTAIYNEFKNFIQKNMHGLKFVNEKNNKLDHFKNEKIEQFIVSNLIESTDIVLELGARYGTVSCTINRILNKKTNQVSVEPDNRVSIALHKNKEFNNSGFHIVNGFISKKKLGLVHKDSYSGYGTQSKEDESSNIPIHSLEEIQDKYDLKFNVLVADCEGCLENFFKENPKFLDQLRMIIYEQDYTRYCDYKFIEHELTKLNFVRTIHGDQNVWLKLDH